MGEKTSREIKESESKEENEKGTKRGQKKRMTTIIIFYILIKFKVFNSDKAYTFLNDLTLDQAVIHF